MFKEVKVCINDSIVERPVAKFIQVAGMFDSKIQIVTEQGRINAKSIMGMMNLGLEAGRTLVIEANGSDEAEAIEALENFLKKGA